MAPVSLNRALETSVKRARWGLPNIGKQTMKVLVSGSRGITLRIRGPPLSEMSRYLSAVAPRDSQLHSCEGVTEYTEGVMWANI